MHAVPVVGRVVLLVTVALCVAAPAVHGQARGIPAHPRELKYPPLAYEAPNRMEHRHELAGGVPAYVVEDHQLPLVDVIVIARGGSYLDPDGKPRASRNPRAATTSSTRKPTTGPSEKWVCSVSEGPKTSALLPSGSPKTANSPRGRSFHRRAFREQMERIRSRRLQSPRFAILIGSGGEAEHRSVVM
jgi:hypothetical protein